MVRAPAGEPMSQTCLGLSVQEQLSLVFFLTGFYGNLLKEVGLVFYHSIGVNSSEGSVLISWNIEHIKNIRQLALRIISV